MLGAEGSVKSVVQNLVNGVIFHHKLYVGEKSGQMDLSEVIFHHKLNSSKSQPQAKSIFTTLKLRIIVAVMSPGASQKNNEVIFHHKLRIDCGCDESRSQAMYRS